MIGAMIRGRYELTQELSEGPVFKAFAAKDHLQGRDVCLRVAAPNYAHEPDFAAKLEDTVRAVLSISHPNLERLLAADRDDSNLFVVSEYSRGTSLLERLKKLGTLSVPVAVQTAIGVCEALQALHSAGVVHGDVGSHNVVIGPEGDLKLQQYAVWQAYASSATAGTAVLRQIAPYLAPEIGQGAYPSPSSDVYAVGVLLYEMLSGRYPFHADAPVAIAVKHATEGVPNVRMMNPSVPVVLAEIVKKAMAKSPADRYRDGGDMVSDLRILQDALRFGRTLSWPIREESKPAPPLPVAPKMSAIREPKRQEEAIEEDEWEDERSEDVPVWVKVMIAFFAGLMAILVLAWVVFNMSKPRTVEVPDLKRLSVTEAMSRLDGLGLKLKIGRRQANDQIPKDQIIDETPAPGEQVYEGSSVNVTVSAGTKFVEVPDVRGLTVDQAKSMLGSVDLELDPEKETVADPNLKAGLIVGQIPEARRKVSRMSKIHVQVSGGKDVKVKDDKSAKTKYQWTLRITLSDIKEPVTMRVDITDAKGTRTIHEAEHEPEEYAEIIAEGYGDKATFRIFYDGELVSQLEKTADDPDAEKIE